MVLLAACLAACASEEVGATRAAVNGTVDDGSYPGVVGMFINKPEGVARCTGVLVAPNLVLTARHCIAPTTGAFVDCGRSPLGPPVDGANVLSTTMGTMPTADPPAYVAGARVQVPAEGNDECGFDIAAVFLARNLDASEATPFPPRLDTEATAGEPVTAVGFGSTGGGGGLGVRRVGEGLEVACVGADDCPGPFVQPTELQVGDGVFCQSDSGAPAFDADGMVIGVTSRGVNPCDAPILSATFAWATWLRTLGREAAADGGYETPAWALEPTVTPDAGADSATGDASLPDSSAADAGDGSTGDSAIDVDGSGGCSAASNGRPSYGGLMLWVGLALYVRRRRP